MTRYAESIDSHEKVPKNTTLYKAAYALGIGRMVTTVPSLDGQASGTRNLGPEIQGTREPRTLLCWGPPDRVRVRLGRMIGSLGIAWLARSGDPPGSYRASLCICIASCHDGACHDKPGKASEQASETTNAHGSEQANKHASERAHKIGDFLHFALRTRSCSHSLTRLKKRS